MLDPARHFLSIETLHRVLDGMALMKLNVLHLHLTDDQGFRFESLRYPRLASEQHYSQVELRKLVDKAARRGIRVVPEFDMPGHVTSWLTAYPEWGSRPVAATDRFGVHDGCLNPASEEVYQAVGALLKECVQVFPDVYLHMGGDEVSGRWWREDPGVETLMRREGLADTAAVQAYFNTRVANQLALLGRRLIAWDEVLNGTAPEGCLIQSWRGATARDRALAAGHDCIVSSGYYLDLHYPADVHHAYDPGASSAALLAAEDALLDDPRLAHVADGMRWTSAWREAARGEVKAAVLGAEACLWSELVTDEILDPRLWSRLPAVADRFWSAAEVRDTNSLYRRLENMLDVLDQERVARVTEISDALLLRAGVLEHQLPLVRLLEPVKWYGRLLGEVALKARIEGREMPQARPYKVSTPLDRPVDALLPESLAAREFVAAIEDPQAFTTPLTRWRDIAGGNDWLEELQPSADALGVVFEALLDVFGGADVQAARERVTAVAEPQGEYILAVVIPVLDWLDTQ
tara:strand:- start:4485 stop:6044 length:1560 start_codon:yes stop_codon:yes gene_type:complete